MSSDLGFLSDVSSAPSILVRKRSKSVPHVKPNVPDRHFFYEPNHFGPIISPTPWTPIYVPNIITLRKSCDQVKRELRDISENQRFNQQAYENHSNWLISLSREVAAFNPVKDSSSQRLKL